MTSWKGKNSMTGTHFTSRFAISPAEAATFGTKELRANFLVTDLFAADQINLTYSHYDRMILGGANPVSEELRLESIKPTGTANFLDRREMIAVNIGQAWHRQCRRSALRTRPPRHDLCRYGCQGCAICISLETRGGQLLPHQRAGASDPSNQKHQYQRREADRPWRAGNQQ